MHQQGVQTIARGGVADEGGDSPAAIVGRGDLSHHDAADETAGAEIGTHHRDNRARGSAT